MPAGWYPRRVADAKLRVRRGLDTQRPDGSAVQESALASHDPAGQECELVGDWQFPVNCVPVSFTIQCNNRQSGSGEEGAYHFLFS